MSDWHPQANEIFRRVVELPAEEQRRLLDEACAGQPEVRAQVESLLVAAGRAGSFLERPVVGRFDVAGDVAMPQVGEPQGTADLGRSAESHLQPGELIGRYKLLQLLGEGGMGAVYMAEQLEPVRRRVAVKIIKPGLDSRQVVARFEAERQALALMDSPHIARVLDAGTTDKGRPYFVMELVQGVPITQYCDENRLTVRDRLELFLPVCRAIQHAHQKGIIHRDVKPSNVLVTMHDGQPVPKVIDFGVAKAVDQQLTEKTLFTQFGALVGTLEYMSPEQAEMSALGVDTRSDVYALGVLLYELLTGTTPLERQRLRQAALGEVLRWIKEEEPPMPSSRVSTTETRVTIASRRHVEPDKLSRLVRGDLDWIVMKCLEKDRTRRYETANALARDLERHLADEAVEASPPTVAYRLRKFARKHRAALLTALAFLGLLMAATVVSVWQAARATLAEVDAYRQRNVAQKALGLAEQRAQAETAARKDLERAAFDLFESLGIAADARKDQAEAGLWFARAARLPADPHRRWANDVRIRTWNQALPRLVAARRRPGRSMWRLAFHPTLPFLLSSSTDHQWVLWDWSQDKLVEMSAEGQPVRSALWSADGARLFLGTAGGTVRILRFPAMAEERRIEHRGEVRVLAESPDGTLLALGGQSARVWNLSKNEFVTPELVVTHRDNQVRSLAFSHRGDRLAVGDSAYAGAVFQVPAEGASAKPVGKVFAHGDHDLWTDVSRPVPPVFMGNDRFVLSVDRTRGLLARDASTGQSLKSVVPGEPPTVVIPVPGGRRLLFPYNTVVGSVEVDERGPLPSVVSTIELGHTNSVTHLAVGTDGQTLLTGSRDHTAVLRYGDQDRRGDLRIRHAGALNAVALTPNRHYAATAQHGGVLCVWDLQVNPFESQLTTLAARGSLVRLSIDGSCYLPAGSNALNAQELSGLRSTNLYDVATAKPISPELSPGGLILDAFPSPDRRYIAIVTNAPERSFRQGKLHYLDSRTGEPLWPAREMPSEPRSVRVRRDGRQLAVCCAAGQVVLLDSPTGRVERQLQAWQGDRRANQYVNNGKAEYSPDGSLLVASGGFGEGPPVWSSATGELRYVLTQSDQEICIDVQFSPDGRFAATAGFDSTLRIWNMQSGRPEVDPIPHPDWLWTTRFSPDGKLVATACNDQAVRVWDWRRRRLACPPLEHGGAMLDVAFVPKTPWLMTIGLDRTLRIWDTTTGKPLAPRLATGSRGLNLVVTPDGRRAFVGTTGDKIRAFSLTKLHAGKVVDLESEVLRFELLSCRRIVDDRGTSLLTSDEWFDRWTKYRRRMPVTGSP